MPASQVSVLPQPRPHVAHMPAPHATPAPAAQAPATPDAPTAPAARPPPCARADVHEARPGTLASCDYGSWINIRLHTGFLQSFVMAYR